MQIKDYECKDCGEMSMLKRYCGQCMRKRVIKLTEMGLCLNCGSKDIFNTTQNLCEKCNGKLTELLDKALMGGTLK